MVNRPKLKKQDRLDEKRKEHASLLEYRRSQAALAIYRDDDCCTVCYFLLGKHTRRADVHHVFSRGKLAGDWRECHTNLLCVCRKHHPSPIHVPGANSSLAWVEEILRQANGKTINPRFIPPDMSPRPA